MYITEQACILPKKHTPILVLTDNASAKVCAARTGGLCASCLCFFVFLYKEKIYMKFGVYLEELIRDRKLSINALSNACNINRGGLYSVFRQTRQLKPEQLYVLISKLSLTRAEEKKLIDLYYIDLYGRRRYEKILYLIKQIESCAVCESTESDMPVAENDCILKLKKFISENSSITTNFPYSFAEADALFYQGVKNGAITEFVHILALDEKDDYKYNYTAVFKSLKYMYLGQFPYYYFNSFIPKNCELIMPYFAVGNKSALLFGKETAVLVRDEDSVQILAQEAQKLIQGCKCFGMQTKDIMFIKDSFQKGASAGSVSITLSNYPCLAMYVDKETMENAVRPELPNKESLVEIAYAHYSSMYKLTTPIVICSEAGMKSFADSGEFSEISGSLIKGIDAEYRVRVLKNVVEGIKADKFYLLDKNRISIPKGLEIEKYADRILFGAYNEDEPGFSSYDAFFAEFESYSFVEDFRCAAEYLMHSRFVCAKEYSVQFVNSLIAGLGAKPE